MRIERIAVARLNPAAYNPRVDLKPGDAEYEKLKRSLDEFGLVEPVVWNRRTGNVVGGHQRLKVLTARGDTHADVSVVNLSPEREKALNLALNRISGGWDERKLAELLSELVETPDFDVSLTGFDPPEVEELLAGVLGGGGGASDGASGEPERFDAHAAMLEADESKGPAVTKQGELLVLGEHRLWCGDCTDAVGVASLMTGGRAVLFATDPPYLVNYDGTNHFTSNRSSKRGTGRSLGGVRAGSGASAMTGRGLLRRDQERRGRGEPAHGGAGRSRGRSAAKDWSGSYGITWDDADANSDLYERFIETAIAEAILPGAPWYCWHASKRQAMLESVWNRFGAFVHQQIIWVKNRPVLTRSFYTWQHEPCLMGWIKGNQPKRVAGEPMRSTVWTADIPSAGGGGGPPVAVVRAQAMIGAISGHGHVESGGTGGTGASGGSGGSGGPGGRPEHPTPKPLILFETPMRQHTRVGDVVYEPFCGSGTQLIAAERLKRRCRAVEISPQYCDVIVRRWLAAVPPERAPREMVKRYLAGVKAAAVPAAPMKQSKAKPCRGASSVTEFKPMKRGKSGVRAEKKGAPRR